MKKEDVPQQSGLAAGVREVNYAIDGDGHYTLEQSLGWKVKDIALNQAWEEILEQLRKVLDEIKSAKKSALAYHMVKNQMDVTMLCQYSGVPRWRVKRHLKPKVFAKLNAIDLAPYTELFGLSIDELYSVPDEPLPPWTELNK